MLPWAGVKWDHLVVVIWDCVDTAAVCFHWSWPHHCHQNLLPLVGQLCHKKNDMRIKLRIYWSPNFDDARYVASAWLQFKTSRCTLAEPTWGSYLMRMSYSIEWGMLSTVNSRKAPSGTLTSPTPVQVGVRSSGWGLGTTVTPWGYKINNLPPRNVTSNFFLVSLKSQGRHRVYFMSTSLPVRTSRLQLHTCSDPDQWSRTLIPPDHNAGRTCALCRCTGLSSGHTWKDGKKQHIRKKNYILLIDYSFYKINKPATVSIVHIGNI